LAAMEAGLLQTQIQDLGLWVSASMAGRCTSGDPSARKAMSKTIRI
jgi:hypothetical protein